MVSNFDFQAKFKKSEQLHEGGVLLLRFHSDRQATIMFWLSVRDCLFAWLEMNQIQFDSTPAALVIAMSNPELREFHSAFAFTYMVGTMSEWDEAFSITNEQAVHYKKICEELVGRLKR